MRKFNDQIDKVNTQIQENRILECLETLEEICEDFQFSRFIPQVVTLKARLGEYEERGIYGTLSADDVSLNKIRESCLTLKNAIEVAERTKSGEKGLLFKKAREGQRKAYSERSHKKLAGRDMIDLEVSYTVEGSHDLAPLLNLGVIEGQKKHDIFKVFEAASGRLLIIGLPGSGKTTLLLYLAVALLDKYRNHIPVVLDIATWKTRFRTIEEWALELLPDMGFNKSLAQELIVEKRLVPLFDGLDELRVETRPDFLTAVEKYGSISANKFVITSRKAEYASTIDAAVEYQVVVNSFTLLQIREALQKKTSPEKAAMLHRINKDVHFREAIKTPFYLNTVQLLFSHKNLSQKLEFKADHLKGRQREIEIAFVEFALVGMNNYSKEDAGKWLAFLADRMNRRGMVRFELADMQYDWGPVGWWGKYWSKLLFEVIRGLVGGLSGGLLVGLVGGLFDDVDGGFGGLSGGFIFGLVYGLIINLFAGLVSGFYKGFLGDLSKIIVKDKTKWTLKGYIFYLQTNLAYCLLGGMIAGIAYGLLAGLLKGMLLGMFLGFLVGFAVISFICMVGMINNSFNAYLKINKPYQRFYGSMRSLHFSILQHWHLCYLLRKKGLIPRRYPDFLQAATEQNILESDGGSWRFRHRILQEYFVRVWEEEYGSDEALKDYWHPEE